MDTNNPTESSYPSSRESQSIQIQSKNKIRVVNIFFILLNIFLSIMLIVSNYIFDICSAYDLGCGLTRLIFIVFGFPFLMLILWAVMSVIYDSNKGVPLKNFNEIKHSQIFKQNAKYSTFLAVLILIPIAFQTYHDFSSRQEDEKYSSLKYDLRSMGNALQQYKIKTGYFPSNLNDLVSSGYIQKIPLNPMNNKPFEYIQYSNGTKYSICGQFYDNYGSGNSVNCITQASDSLYKYKSDLHEETPTYPSK